MTIRRPLQAVIGLLVGVVLAGVVVPSVTRTDRTVVRSAAAGASGGGGVTHPSGSDAGGFDAASGPAVSGGAPKTGVTGAGAVSGAPTARTALPNVRGVDRTKAIMRVGVILYDISGAADLGVSVPNVSPEDQKRMYGAYISELNQRGGIGGLKVEPVYATVNALAGASSEREACISLTEDNSVYAVLNVGTLRSPSVLCLTEEHHVLAVLPGMSGIQDSVFARAGDLLFTIQARGSRSVTDAADAFNAAGYFKGKTVGLTDDEGSDPGGEVGNALEAHLKKLGIKVAYRSRFSADTDTAASQTPLEVSQHRSHGVDLIILLHANGYQFVQAAEANGYFPKYAATDWNSYFSDSVTQQMPVSFDGTPIYTHSTTSAKNVNTIPEYDVQKRCRETYEKQTGRTINQKGTGTEGSAYILLLYVCGGMQMLERGAVGALPSLRYENYAAAMAAIGKTWIAGTGPGSFGPGKHDHADAMVRATWTFGCRCWQPQQSFS